MKRTFVDASVLISAARGKDEIAERATKILDDPNREFASSTFLKLEVLPKAIYYQKQSEVAFYETFFHAVTHWVDELDRITEDAYGYANTFGLGAMDALHVAAAILAESEELITAEKPSKPICQVTVIKVVSLQRSSP